MLSDTHMAVPSLVLLSLCYTARAAAPTTHHGVSEYEPGAGWETLTLTGTQQRVDSNRTIPANTSLRFVDGGGFFVEAGATLTIEGDLTGAPLQQIFAGPGAVRFAAGAVERVLPQWFGCKANGKMDCTVPVQKAIDSIWATNNGMIGQTDGQNGQGGGEIYFPTGIYGGEGDHRGLLHDVPRRKPKVQHHIHVLQLRRPEVPSQRPRRSVRVRRR